MNLDNAIETLVVGYGYWGPNIVRNLIERPEFHLAGLCDRDERRLEEFRGQNPGLICESDLDVALSNPDLEAVAIATPPHTHHAPGSRRAGSGQACPGREAAGADRRRGGRADGTGR